MVFHKVSLVISLLYLPLVILDNSDFKLGDLAQIFAALSGQSTCEFKCPGGVVPNVNLSHVASSNGCGVPGLNLDVSKYPGFTSCCNEHDKCYDTCNKNKDKCDKVFKECLSTSCKAQTKGEKFKECNGVADMFYGGTAGLGCAFFIEAQRNACLCNGKTLSKSEVKLLQDEL
ncbi:group XIIA secretory phospholipase A2 isoform X1 [Hydra vulgaris]|uniref:Group XIIA secretory phospholipase A2 n=1 Tax=Hydra vulgaris TaxID=6087 RepID=T2M5E8_HYDVU|nr:group XIIA secretory phospholipase A2 [Hydra vulgaris]